MKTNISQARINQQIRNMLKQNLPYLKAVPLENDIYTWHFTIQGPQNSDFHQGLYHGHILLPFQYPFKPPDIVFINKNGRFQTNTKICLTITQYHPQEWNSAWTIRTMLQAVISLFNQNVHGVGYQQGSPQQRRALAKKSHNFKCDKCGLLKDVLTPREPAKQQQKKQQEKPKNRNDDHQIPSKKIQYYASQLNQRKVKTQYNRKLSPKTFQKNNSKQSAFEQQSSKKNSSPLNRQSQQIKIQNNSLKNRYNQQKIKITSPDNDSIALNKDTQKKYISWAKAQQSIKLSVIQ